MTSGFEGALTATPTQWSMIIWRTCLLTTGSRPSPAGVVQWQPKDGAAAGTVRMRPTASVARDADDLSLKFDPLPRDFPAFSREP